MNEGPYDPFIQDPPCPLEYGKYWYRVNDNDSWEIIILYEAWNNIIIGKDARGKEIYELHLTWRGDEFGDHSLEREELLPIIETGTFVRIYEPLIYKK